MEIHHFSGSLTVVTDVTPSVVLCVSLVEAVAYVQEDFLYWEFGQLGSDVGMGYADGNHSQTEFSYPTQSFLNVVSSVHLAV